MTDLGRQLETGDATYQERYDRWLYVMKRTKEGATRRAIGAELGIAHQNVDRIIKRGYVKPSGRQKSNEGRKRRIMKRLDLWSSRRATKLAQGLPVEVEDRWIAKLAKRMQELS